MNVHDFAELAAGHALDALSADDERAFQRAASEHPEWAAIVDADVETAAVLADGTAETQPSDELRAALLARFAEERGLDPEEPEPRPPEPAAPSFDALLAPMPWPVADAAPPIEVPVAEADAAADAPAVPEASVPEVAEPTAVLAIRELAPELVPPKPPSDRSLPSGDPPPSTEMLQTVQRRNWTRGLLGLAGAIVLLVGLGFGAAFVRESLTPQPPEVVALEQIESAPDASSAGTETTDGGSLTLHWSDSLGTAVIVGTGLEQLGDGETYQAWYVRGDQFVSAGTFVPGVDGSVTAVLDGAVQPDDVVRVTIEPDGGSEQPTTDPIATIPTSDE